MIMKIHNADEMLAMEQQKQYFDHHDQQQQPLLDDDEDWSFMKDCYDELQLLEPQLPAPALFINQCSESGGSNMGQSLYELGHIDQLWTQWPNNHYNFGPMTGPIDFGEVAPAGTITNDDFLTGPVTFAVAPPETIPVDASVKPEHEHHGDEVTGDIIQQNQGQTAAAEERRRSVMKRRRSGGGGGGGRCRGGLEMEDIQKYFHVPITTAAKEMKVGLTVLKRRCRELKIMRWPHRKIKSLNSLIDNVKEMGMREETVTLLEEHRRLIENEPDIELTEKTKKLRQASFKANYKKRRRRLFPPPPPAAATTVLI